MRVLFLSLDPREAATRTRAEAFLPGLAAAGVEAELRRWPRRAAGLADLGDYDAVVLLRILLPRWAVAAARRAPALILDVDDAIWLRPPRGRRSLRLARRLRRTLEVVDLVSCGSAYLREALRAPRARVLPPAVAVPRSLPPKPEALEVLWTGSGSTLPYLEALGPALRGALEGSGATLVVLADRAPRLPAGIPLRFEPWSPDAERAALERAQIGLYPLPDQAWARGKCAYKVRLYLAHGLASVAVPWGGGAEALAQGEAGRLAADPAAFGRALEELVADPEARAAWGRRGRALALARDDLEVRLAAWLGALREAVALGAARRKDGN